MLIDEARAVDDAEHERLQARIDAEDIAPTFTAASPVASTASAATG